MHSKAQEISDFFQTHKSYVTRMKFLRERHPELCQESGGDLENLYRLITPGYKNTCQVCGAATKFNTFLSGYHRYCSHACSVRDPEVVNRRLTSWQARPAAEAEESSRKRKNTMVKRYGVEHALQNDIFRQQAQEKNLSKTAEQRAEIDRKKRATSIERYGVDIPIRSPEILEKVKRSNLERYGVEWTQQSAKVREKSRRSRKKLSVDRIRQKFSGRFQALFTEDEYSTVDHRNQYLWRCMTCDTEFRDDIDNGSCPVCPTCNPWTVAAQSQGESELVKFLDNLGVGYELHRRDVISPREVDIYVPSRSLAIEYCGLYWHSEKKVSRAYHHEKYQACQQKGIRLIQIFEDEWLSKRDICEDRLRHALSLNQHRFSARQCRISEISGREYKKFVEDHHIQGYVPSTIKIGAWHGDELVAVMSFGSYRPIYRKTPQPDGYELLRFCSREHVPGIANRMLKYFETKYKPQEIISYCDLRWGTGRVYLNMGFEYSHHTGVNYWYTNDGITRHHRSRFAKSKLPKNTENHDLTEQEIMSGLGYYRVWDCGNSCFVKRYG